MQEYIYGKSTVCERIKKGSAINKILVSEKFADPKVLELIKSSKVEVEFVQRKVLDDLTNDANHQGIVAMIESYDYFTLDDLINEGKKVNYPLIVMLDGIEDPHNLGAILRTCDAIGVCGVVVGKHRSAPLSSTVAKVSTGAIEHVKVAQVVNLVSSLEKLKANGYWIVGAEAEDSIDYRKVDYKSPIVLVIGSEGKGISRLVKSHCDYKVFLPMKGHVTSLNASVATAILLYHIHGQQFPL